MVRETDKFDKKIVNMNRVFVVLNVVQYLTLFTYRLVIQKNSILWLMMLIFLIVFVPIPIILTYYGYKIISIINFLGTISDGQQSVALKQSWKKFKKLWVVMVGTTIWRYVQWVTIIVL